MMKQALFSVLTVLSLVSYGQTELFSKSGEYTRQDSLRGSITPERQWWDLQYYDLYVAVDIDKKFISGTNTITYKVLDSPVAMQIDLQSPMNIDKVVQDGKELQVTHEGNAHFISMSTDQKAGDEKKVTIYFSGVPHEAIRAPWDGGWSWAKDENGQHFVATSNQGIGASLWWPCKDHMYDEPDNGITLSINVPRKLVAVGNGRLKEVIKKKNKTRTYVWKVVNPINNYGVNVNIGDYVNFSEKYEGEKGPLDMDYWVLSYNLKKAKEHFVDARRTMEAFEYWFGPYPFYEDSYKLVETPYLGMEHQSSVTYGNGYQKGYKGNDLSYTGWGLKWDYIIIHESGHEWFANNITYKDVADMWVHEGFTMYSESLFVEYFYGKEAGSEYTRGVRMFIDNEEPIIGDYDVNAEGSKDMYNKGNNLLHTLRQCVNDDEKWRSILRGLNEEFYHSVVTSEQVENYIAEKAGLNLEAFFDQYLRDYRIPVLEYRINGQRMLVRWTNCIDGFDMPVKIFVADEEQWINPTKELQMVELPTEVEDIVVDSNFYIYSSNSMK
ncbi:M1 family metallopeptidase [Marinoscillum sp. MHG1-6]|uniref:M1 family metallopeptidase n=1 Tax=Marinoscillum sp. MHG1-6 TaxID=2959627 RepID=UPI0021572463|nr:M1 family metallopeptidase [Marinoscillum sp. MHG1-6]